MAGSTLSTFDKLAESQKVVLVASLSKSECRRAFSTFSASRQLGLAVDLLPT